MAYEDILYEVDGGRATITINRPEKLNAFRGQTILELCDAFERAGDDEAVGVIVFTGALERVTQLEDRLSAEGVELLRAIDGDRRPAACDLVQDVLVRHA